MSESALLTGPLEPTNEWYAIAKIAAIKLREAYRKQHSDDFIAVMPTNLYGPNDNYHPLNSHVPSALSHVIATVSRMDVMQGQQVILDAQGEAVEWRTPQEWSAFTLHPYILRLLGRLGDTLEPAPTAPRFRQVTLQSRKLRRGGTSLLRAARICYLSP